MWILAFENNRVSFSHVYTNSVKQQQAFTGLVVL